jgi:hypothetical protein
MTILFHQKYFYFYISFKKYTSILLYLHNKTFKRGDVAYIYN